MHIDKGIVELERKIGAKSGFFEGLLSEDDWSFIIKLHSLFEAACTHLLMFHFAEPDLNEVLSRMELSNKSVGKLVLLRQLGLLSQDHRRLISKLSELRNSLVHDIRQAEFTLSDYVEGLDKKAMRNFAESFSPYETTIRQFQADPTLLKGIDPQLLKQADIESVTERARENPKRHIWLGAWSTLVSLVDMYSYSDYKQWTKAKTLLDDEDS